jgi:tRNA G18 (ribose-2'-O)-methylase SpoU
MVILAHNLRSLYNLGSIFRNAAAFGVEKVYLTGFTATPPRKEISKVALGGDELVTWEHAELKTVVTELKASGYQVWALETGNDAKSLVELAKDPASAKLALILGNEVSGLDAEALALVDGKVQIPMQHKRSLNVSVASGVAMYVLCRR